MYEDFRALISTSFRTRCLNPRVASMEESQISLDVYRLISRSPWDDWMVLTEVSHEGIHVYLEILR